MTSNSELYGEFSGYQEELTAQIRSWLREDTGSGDVTTRWTIEQGHQSKAVIHAKESGVVAGLPVVRPCISGSGPFLVVYSAGDRWTVD